jgi:hypothetical protein
MRLAKPLERRRQANTKSTQCGFFPRAQSAQPRARSGLMNTHPGEITVAQSPVRNRHWSHLHEMAIDSPSGSTPWHRLTVLFRKVDIPNPHRSPLSILVTPHDASEKARRK